MGRVGRRAALAAAALSLLVAGTACGERSEPTGATVGVYPLTITDATDRTVELSGQPRRIAALTPATGEIVAALGLGKRLVGPTARLFGPKGNLLVSRLRAARPDLILASAQATQVEQQVTPIHAPAYFAPGGSVEEVERAITQLGLILDRPVVARRLVHGIEEQRQLVASKLAGAPQTSVFVDTGFFVTVPEQSLIGDLLREAGGRNIAGANPAPGPFDIGQLIRIDPAVYLATSDSNTTLADLRKDRRTRKLRAVRKDRFFIVDVSLLEPGPSVGDGLLQIAKLLHPNAFR